MTAATESRYLRLCQLGHSAPFDPIVKGYENRVFRALFALTRDYDDARDLTQETFIRAYERIRQFQIGRPVAPWLLAIARNQFRDARRRRREHVRLDRGTADQIPDRTGSWERPARADAARRRVWEALHRMRPPEREILVLKDITELGYAEIASILGIPRGTVASRVYNARRSLARLLTDPAVGSEALLADAVAERDSHTTRPVAVADIPEDS
jgi:RNA polymerase sigma-70 factor (ECF subfamily)